jgi:peptidoglycan/xylan/chitin deacetylase (PgdA/CDA1 family)
VEGTVRSRDAVRSGDRPLGERELGGDVPRRLIGRLVRAAVAVATVGTALTGLAPAAHAAGAAVVSLTFDDGRATQDLARTILAAHGMKGTFYVNSAVLGTSGHLTWSQVDQLARDGNEIGGHTLHHVDLTTVSTATATQEVCDDRARLLKRGYAVTDFAYPYGAGYNSSTVRSVVANCGYNSARRAWGLQGPNCTPTCNYPVAESIPPADIWGIRTFDAVKKDTTLATLQYFVTTAEANGGGWVPLQMHEVCDGCDDYSITATTLGAFLDWLQSRGTTVKTVGQVIGGSVKASPALADTTPPVTTAACNDSPCTTSYTSPVQVSLSATDAGSGVEAIRYTLDGSDPTLTSAVYASPFTVSSSATVKFRAWDNSGNAEATKSLPLTVGSSPPAGDTTPPTTTIACNGAACTTGWYRGSVSVTLSATDDSAGVATIRYTTDGTDPTLSTGNAYAGPFTISATTTVKYRAYDQADNAEAIHTQTIAVDATPPSVAVASPTDGSLVRGTVKIDVNADDAISGVASVAVYVDGRLIGTTTSSPYRVTFNTRKYAVGSHVITAVAIDVAGNPATSSPVSVTITR